MNIFVLWIGGLGCAGIGFGLAVFLRRVLAPAPLPAESVPAASLAEMATGGRVAPAPSKPSSLDRWFVPSASDQRWRLSYGRVPSAACGPFKILVYRHNSAQLFVSDDAFENPILDVSDGDVMRRFADIEIAQGRDPWSESNVAKKVRNEQLAAALAWHRQNEPRPLGPEDADVTRKGPMR